MNAEDYWLLGGISLFILLYIVMAVRRVRRELPHYNYQTKRTRGLLDNKVHYGPSEPEIDQIVSILANTDQPYTAEEVDRLAYDKDDVWVMYAYDELNSEKVQGAMIAEKIGSRMHILAYGVDPAGDPADQDAVTSRLVHGIAWEGVQTDTTSRPSFNQALGGSEAELAAIFDRAYRQYSEAKINPPDGVDPEG